MYGGRKSNETSKEFCERLKNFTDEERREFTDNFLVENDRLRRERDKQIQIASEQILKKSLMYRLGKLIRKLF